ncbi:MAG: DUF4810 domain-containing protein [Bacteroidales bacterium]|nr:DUF4810 domain-containing protein [Bacteroidales bacterium]
MKRLLIIFASAFLLSSCATTSELYYWGNKVDGVSKYEKLTYKNYDRQTPESICDLVELYEDMVSNPGGTRNTIPPGICAEYGFLLLQERTLDSFEKYAKPRQKRIFNTDDYATLFEEKGIEMLRKEVELYPESETFIGPIIKQLTSDN